MTAPQPQRPAITGLSSMAFYASDVKQTLEYYRKVHGFEDQKLVTDDKGALQSALVRINERQWVELRPELAAATDRLIQFGLEVADAEALRVWLGSKGWEVPPATTLSPQGNRSFVVKDPDNHLVEFAQYLPTGWPLLGATLVPMPSRLSTCLMHTGFAVASLEKSLAFYQDLLGCREFWRGSSNEKTLAWVHLKLPEDENYVEFMLYDEPPTLEWLGVLNHFGLEVTQMAPVMEEVSRRVGVKPYPREIGYSIGKCRHRLANVYDPDGTRAEFMERNTFDGMPTPSSPLPGPA